jgi:Protein of unknown function (DUF4019)
MKTLSALIVAATVFAAQAVLAQESPAVAAAKVSADAWLKRMDAADYAGTWETSAASMHSEMSKSSWKMLITALHWPLGDFKSRKFKSAVLQKAPAGKPGPDKVVIDYLSQYENKADVKETVTTSLEKDNSWKVSGFNING